MGFQGEEMGCGAPRRRGTIPCHQVASACPPPNLRVTSRLQVFADMPTKCILCLLIGFFAVPRVFVVPSVFAADGRDQEEFFETKIRPVLVAKCYECHSAAADEPAGGLLLDTREGIRRGGETGHAVVPGELADSLILDAMRHESIEMPPDERLPDTVIADFEKWVRAGAYDPRDGKSAMIRREIDFGRAKEFWSFRPLVESQRPAVEDVDWARSDIDAFILARWENQGITPVGDADGATLARRIYFDLIGLPPSPAEVDSFVAAMQNDPQQAVAALVDTLLDSPQFGERWGRHWLDVVRYAESTGMERNATFTQAWRYRDYVIDAFNGDMPFDQFTRQQVAGDLLPYQSQQQRDRQLIATGMLALGPKSLNEPKAEKFQMDVVDEQIDVVTRAFLGLTVSCARCHDHKFDPIPQSEYYSLAGIFTSTDTFYGTAKTNGNRNPGRLLAITGDTIKPAAAAGDAGEEKRYRNQLKALQKKLQGLETQIAKAKNATAKRAVEKRIGEAKDDIRRARNRLAQSTQPAESTDAAMLVMAVAEADQIADTDLRIRGEPDEHGREIPRGFLTIASLEENPSLPEDCSGRLELADWITRPSNPLPARVAANRVWQHLFGRGLVRTVNNFGANGDRPTHPLLLDHLATSLIQNGWSVKQLIRQIMLSRVYQLSCDDQLDALQADPGNELFWRMNQRRLEAEAIRDAILMVSGQLELTPPSGSPVQKLGEGIIGRNLNTTQLASGHRSRSVYLPIVRGAVPEFLGLFDFPEPSIVGGMRDVTTVPTQALFMMNSPMVIDSASKLAQRIAEQVDGQHAQRGDDATARVQQAYRVALSRHASESEIGRALQFITETEDALRHSDQQNAAEAEASAWTAFCQSLLASSEFRYIN